MKITSSIFKTFLLSLLIIAQIHFARAQTAALLPNASQVFLDNNGNPLSSGTVSFYTPGTMTSKMVWQDANQTTPWTQPITLNAAGRPPGDRGIYGNGTYRQIVKAKNTNTIWDGNTAAVGTGGGSGSSVGDGNSVGTILTWSGMIAPNQYQFAYGQSLSRATFPELYQAITLQTSVTCVGGNATLTGISDTSNIPIGANVEGSCIVAGTTVLSKTINTVTLSVAASISTTLTATFFPYGNGNGTTTFNVPDLRGKVIPGRTNMGGVTASNLTSTYYGSSPDAVGANGGSQSKSLSVVNLAQHNHGVFLNDPGHNHPIFGISTLNGTGTSISATTNFGPAQPANMGTTNNNTTGITVRSASGGGGTQNQTADTGSGTAFSLIQPSITLNYIIKVTPDTSVSGLFGVASIGGMQGIIACGAGLVCAGNTISTVGNGDVIATSITLSPTADSSNQAISSLQTAAGTNLVSNVPAALSGSYSLNTIKVSGDTVSLFDPTGLVNAFSVIHSFGGASANGGRQAFYAQANLAAADNPSNPSPYYVAGTFWSQTAVNNGGTGLTSGTSRGGLWGANPVVTAYSGATNYNQLVGVEVNTNIQSGASTYLKAGMSIAQGPSDAVQGAVFDAALLMSNAVGAVGWKDGIQFSNGNGSHPVAAAGSLIATRGAKTVTNGVDFSSYTFTGHAFKSANFSVDGSGVISGPSGFAVAGDGSTATNTVVGGGAASSSLTLKSTFGVGASDSIKFVVGNNGATEAGRIDTGGNWHLGGTTNAAVPFKLRVETANAQGLSVNSTATPSTSSGGGVSAGLSALPSAADQRLAFFYGYAEDSLNTRNAGGMSILSSQAWSAGAAFGSYLKFESTPNGSTTRTEGFRLDQDQRLQFTSASMVANGSVATAMSSLGPTGSHTTVQEWFVIKNASGTLRYIPAF